MKKLILSIMIAIGSLLCDFTQYMVNAEEQDDRFHNGFIETEVLYKSGNTVYYSLPSEDQIVAEINAQLFQKYGDTAPDIRNLDYNIDVIEDYTVTEIGRQYKSTTYTPTQPWVYSTTGGSIIYRSTGGGSFSFSVSVYGVGASISVPYGVVGASTFDYSFNFPANKYCKLQITRTYLCVAYHVTWTEDGVDYSENTVTSSLYSLQGTIIYQ